jgi:hypothetical protein
LTLVFLFRYPTNFPILCFFSEIYSSPTSIEFYPRVLRKTYFRDYQSFLVIISIAEDSQSEGDEINLNPAELGEPSTTLGISMANSAVIHCLVGD